MTGVVTLSVELELAWGMHDKSKYDHLSTNRESETRALNRLLDIATQANLPISFNIVGHLFHDTCCGTHSGPHPQGWWNEDPGTDRYTDPLFYAPDLICEIRSRDVDHEIATHTYSHLLADETTSEHLDHELSRVEEMHADFGIPEPESIVMPRHQHPDYSVLSEHGIKTIRRTKDEDRIRFSNPFSKFWWLLTRNHPESKLQRRNGLLETIVTPYPSLSSGILPVGQSSPHRAFSSIPRWLRRRLHRQYLIDAINTAADNESHTHLWTHVFNIANNDQWAPISDALSHLAARRDNGDVVVKPMNQLHTIEDQIVGPR